MRRAIWRQGLMWSTQPEAGFPPEDEASEPTGGGGGGTAEKSHMTDRPPGTSTEETEQEMVDFPPGNANPAMGID